MQLLTYKEVAAKLAIHPIRVYDFLRTDETFPKPFKLSERSNRWLESDLDTWINNKKEKQE